MINWVRVSTKITADPSVARIAADLRIKMPHAVGLTVAVFCQLPDHARDGNLTPVPDALVEQWAGWDGKAGRFATAFRRELCDERGTVRSWERYNGAPMREAEADAQRKREIRRTRPGHPADIRRTEGRTSGGCLPLRDETDVVGKNSAPYGAESSSPTSSQGERRPDGALAPRRARAAGLQRIGDMIPEEITAMREVFGDQQ